MIWSHSERALHGAMDFAAETAASSRVIGFTAAMKASLTSTERLKLDSRPATALGVDEVLDIGMIAGQGRHHRAAPRARAHDGAAHRVPHFHEGDRPRGIRAHARHRRAPRPSVEKS